MKKLIGIGVAALLMGSSPAAAEQSVYTDIDLGGCQQAPVDMDDPLETGVWLCPGYLGIPVWITESDLRFFVSYGANAINEIAAHETLPPFNYINSTLEWRLDDDGQPFATILRFFADSGDGGPELQILVVTAISSDGVCHAAYVNASVNTDANQLAQTAADLFARNFSCGYNTPLWIGDPGGF